MYNIRECAHFAYNVLLVLKTLLRIKTLHDVFISPECYALSLIVIVSIYGDLKLLYFATNFGSYHVQLAIALGCAAIICRSYVRRFKRNFICLGYFLFLPRQSLLLANYIRLFQLLLNRNNCAIFTCFVAHKKHLSTPKHIRAFVLSIKMLQIEQQCIDVQEFAPMSLNVLKHLISTNAKRLCQKTLFSIIASHCIIYLVTMQWWMFGIIMWLELSLLWKYLYFLNEARHLCLTHVFADTNFGAQMPRLQKLTEYFLISSNFHKMLQKNANIYKQRTFTIQHLFKQKTQQDVCLLIAKFDEEVLLSCPFGLETAKFSS